MAFGDNATLFPVYGQALDFIDIIDSSTTGNPVDGATLTLTISKSGGAFAAAAGTATQIGTSGFVKVSLTAADMTGKPIAYLITSTGANAIYAAGVITPISIAEGTDHWLDRTPVKLEDALMVVAQYIQNRVEQDDTGAIRVYAKGSTSSVLWQMATDHTDVTENKSEATA